MSGLLAKKLTTGAMLEIGQINQNVSYAAINILVVNNSTMATPAGEAVEIYIADGSSPTPGAIDVIEPAAILPAKGKLEWNCRLVSPGEKIFVKAPAGYTVRVESADEVLPE
jgi:hypothetical protein